MRPEFRLSWHEGPGAHSFQLDSQLVESLSRRHVVLLDTSVWNRLADGREEGASAIKSKLLRLKDAERIFCPLAAPNIWELRKQAGASLYRTAELMEELSENVVFRQVDQLASYEVDAFLAYLLGNTIKPLGINEKFAPLLGYLAPEYELSGTEAVAQHITQLLHTSIHSIVLQPLIRMRSDERGVGKAWFRTVSSRWVPIQ